MDKGLDVWEAGCEWSCFVHRKGHFQKIHTQETQMFWHQNLHTDKTEYTCDIVVYMGRTGQRTAQHLAASHAAVSQLTWRIQGWGHKRYTDNYFFSPALFNDLAMTHIYCCGTVSHNRKAMPQDLGPKKKRLKQGDIQVRTGGELTAILWRGKCDVHMLTNIRDAPAEGNFCNNNGKAIKPQIVADYYRHMGCMDKGYRIC
jgi:hypothetical protein